MDEKPRKRSPFRIFRFIILGFVLAAILTVVTFVSSVVSNIPDLSEIENPQSDLSTQIYSADGVLIRSLYNEKHRINVPLNEISPHVLNALIATEDIRYYQHSGIDPQAIMAILKDMAKGKKTRGGSTITMQLARNMYDKIGRERTIFRKAAEMITAVILERKFTKEEIITYYLNTVSFVGNTYGIQNGSRIFFQKDASELNKEEAALLVGLLKGPGTYNPIRHYERGLARRNTIIEQMQKYGFVEKPEADSLKELPINLSQFRKDDHNVGLAPYFTEHLRGWMSDWCKENGYDLYRDGLRVYTTIDSRMQRHAEDAMKEHLAGFQRIFYKHIKNREPWKRDTTILTRLMTRSERYNKGRSAGKTREEIEKEFRTKIPMTVFEWNNPKDSLPELRGAVDTLFSPWDSLKYYSRFLETGFMSIDPHTGHVKTWVGGIDHRFFQYDHVHLGKRQVGSTFKPFVYTAAFDNGYSPCTKELNQPVYFYNEEGELSWAPKNADGKVGGYMTLRRGLATSTNLITARLMKAIGAEVVCQYAYNMGIQSNMECVPSLALGTSDLSVFELTGAYATFVNKGVWNEPIFVTRIEDKNGNIIETFKGEQREAIDQTTAYLMLNMLMGVVDEPGGTGGRLRFVYKFRNQMGGKTGTTQNHSDGWFMGVTPHLVCGVWVGCAERNIRFRSIQHGQGAAMALPIYGKFMQKLYGDPAIGLPTTPFVKPTSLDIELNCDRYVEPSFFTSDSSGTDSRSVLDFDD